MDQIIEVKGTALVGLPKKYAPAELDMKAFRLRIGEHEMTFFPYLKQLLEEQPYDLRITASWDRESTLRPPYINLHIQPKGKDYSYMLLLNLDTLDVIELEIIVKTLNSKTLGLPLELNARTKEDIRKSIRTIKVNPTSQPSHGDGVKP